MSDRVLKAAGRLQTENDELRAIAKELAEALDRAERCCEHIHHNKGDFHGPMEPCPVEGRINAALTRYKSIIGK
jgi:hypothetical protein